MVAWEHTASRRVQVKVTAVLQDDTEVAAALPGENLKLRVSGIEEDEVSPGFVLSSVVRPVPEVTYFDAQIQVGELLEHKPIMTGGYNAILHIHSVTEECEVSKLFFKVDPRTKEKTKVSLPGCMLVWGVWEGGMPVVDCLCAWRGPFLDWGTPSCLWDVCVISVCRHQNEQRARACIAPAHAWSHALARLAPTAHTQTKFVKSGMVAIVRIALERSICVEKFDVVPQLGRFTLRDEGRTIAIGKVIKLPRAQTAGDSAEGVAAS